jgi:hypothetical protein
VEVTVERADASEASDHIGMLGLDSCTHIQSAPAVSAHARKPLLAAERMPFRLSVTRRKTMATPA